MQHFTVCRMYVSEKMQPGIDAVNAFQQAQTAVTYSVGAIEDAQWRLVGDEDIGL